MKGYFTGRGLSGATIKIVALVRNLVIFIGGVWYFEFKADYVFPAEDNLLL